MKGLQATHPSATASSHHPRFLLLVVFSVGMVFAFVLSACSAHALSAWYCQLHTMMRLFFLKSGEEACFFGLFS